MRRIAKRKAVAGAERSRQRLSRLACKPRNILVDKRTRSEAFARERLEKEDLSLTAVRRALELAVVPLSSNRKNVIPQGETEIQSSVCGLYVFAGNIGVTNFSRQNPWLTKLLAAFGKRSGRRNAQFTSIQINRAYAARPHVDAHNLGRSLIIGLGRYSGGSLWVHDDNGKDTFTLEDGLHSEPLYKKGVLLKGRSLNIRNRWQEFDGNRLHFTQPFRGQRYSLVYFTLDRYAEVPTSVSKELHGFGLTVPSDVQGERLQRLLKSKKEKRAKLVTSKAKERHSFHKGVVPHLVSGDCVQYEPSNVKLEGSKAYLRYEGYRRSRTVGEARRRGALPIDFIFDYNFGFLNIQALHAIPPDWNVEVRDPKPLPSRTGATRQLDATLKVRVAGMSKVHPGLEVPRVFLGRLVRRVPSLRETGDEDWASACGPLTCLSLPLARSVFYWADTGRLRFKRPQLAALRKVFAAWGLEEMADLVKAA